MASQGTFVGSSELAPVLSSTIPVTEGALADPDSIEKVVFEEEGVDEEWTYPDGGLRAWTVVFGCWCFAASQLSYPLIWGVMVEDLNRRFPNEGLAKLNLIGGLSIFLSNVTAFISGRMGDTFGYKPVIALGCVTCTLSIVASALSYKSIPLLFVFQGGFLGVSLGIGFPICMSLPSQWFQKKRGLATGVAISGLGFGGAAYALVIRALLPKLGYRDTLFCWAAINTVACGICLLCVKPRLPPLKPGESRARPNWLPKGVWKDSAFYAVVAVSGLVVFGYLTPPSFLVVYAQEVVPTLSVSGIQPAIPVVVLCAASGFGRILAGQLADRFGPVNMLITSCVVGGILQVAMWPFAKSLTTISMFAMLYGLIASWTLSLLPVVCAQLFGMQGLATIVGFTALCSGPGTLSGASISGAVLSASGNDWRALASYAGGCMLAGSAFLIYVRFERHPKLFSKY